MRIHREGTASLLIVLALVCVVNIPVLFFWGINPITGLLLLISMAFFGFILNFFRNPPRHTQVNANHIICPADGKVVVIEKVFEPEYLKRECIQVSVFMSPLNVHANRYPIAGTVSYMKYHPGLYLVAWHPKSSTENERTTVAVKNSKTEILFRQIAGKVARRIMCYAKEGDTVIQGGEFGFIKFGSRVDVFMPLDAKITVQLNEVVRGGETVLAEI